MKPAAFSASSRLFDLNGDAKCIRKKPNNATIVADVKRFCHQINTDEVLGTHSLLAQLDGRFDVACNTPKGLTVQLDVPLEQSTN